MKVYSAAVVLISSLKSQLSYSESVTMELPGSHSKYSQFKFDQFLYMNLGLAS